MRYLAVDFGLCRLGLAVSDESETFVSPYATRERVGLKKDVAEVVAAVRALGAGAIVMGLALTSEGDAVHHGEQTQAFARKLQAALRAAQLPDSILWWDERNSTREALGQMRAAAVSQRQGREGGAGGVDARAAAVILQGFLDHRQEQLARAKRESEEAVSI